MSETVTACKDDHCCGHDHDSGHGRDDGHCHCHDEGDEITLTRIVAAAVIYALGLAVNVINPADVMDIVWLKYAIFIIPYLKCIISFMCYGV